MSKRILFLLKKNGDYSITPVKSGLLNSCKMLADALIKNGISNSIKLSVCTDANDIDREASQYKPSIAIIEALWVTPSKLREIQRLHKRVKFIVRIHSNIPFLAMEGIAMKWLFEYQDIPNVTVAFNNERTDRDCKNLFRGIYLPNIYFNEKEMRPNNMEGELNIACFGAIRPLKNQLLQAVAAINLADSIQARLNFHINKPRVEQGGESVLKNIQHLFDATVHRLVEHPWMVCIERLPYQYRWHLYIRIILYKFHSADAI